LASKAVRTAASTTWPNARSAATRSRISEPYHDGRPGTLMRAAKAWTAAGAGLTVVAGRTRLGAIASGTLLAAGSLLTRFGVFEAGMASARDPKYTVVPQRERMAARENSHAPTTTS